MGTEAAEKLLEFLPAALRRLLEGLEEAQLSELEEIRLRLNKPVELIGARFARLYTEFIPDAEFFDLLLECFCAHAVFSREESIRKGLLLLPGGFRIGLSGSFFPDRPVVLQGFCIRIPNERIGCSKELLPLLRGKDGRLENTLLLSPPGVGKTTLLRDMIRALSWGLWGCMPERICVVDERSELGACGALDLGPRTDLLSGLSRCEGIERGIRTLRPSLIATDEIGDEQDARALENARLSGLRILASAHGEGISEAKEKPQLRCLLPYFQNCVRLFRKKDGTLGFQLEERDHERTHTACTL